MKVSIIGGGSIGLLISHYLSGQHDVTIYVRRQAQKEQINMNGLYIGEKPVRKCVRALLLSELQTADCLIICVKQTELNDVIPFIQTRETVPTIFLQNGMEHIKLIRTLNQPTFVGVVEHGARRLTDNHVEHTGMGMIKIAAYKGKQYQLEHLTDLLDQSHFPVENAASWYQLLSEKLIVNAVINPLTALFGVTNSHIITNPYMNSFAKALCEETANVLQLNGNEQWERVQNIARKTGQNRSSMLSDIEATRPTEIEAITGYIMRLANVNIPYTTCVYQSVKAIELLKGI